MTRFPALSLAALAWVACTGPAAAGADVSSLLSEGRAHLRAHESGEALAAFERADALAGGALESRLWLARGWVAVGRVDDALGAVDELAESGAPERDVDWLLGTALLARAKERLSGTGGDAFTGDLFEDAFRLLSGVAGAGAQGRDDAWLSLAEAAWYGGHLEEARAASERAVELAPGGAPESDLAARVAFAQYAAARGTSDDAAAARHGAAAEGAFARAVRAWEQAGGGPDLVACRGRFATFLAWEGRTREAGEQWERALAEDPDRVDCGAALGALGAEAFATAAERAEGALGARLGAAEPGLGTLAWWRGRAELQLERWDAASACFRRAVERRPEFANSWYFLFRAEMAEGRTAAALDALRTYAGVDRADLLRSLDFDPRGNVALLDRLVGSIASAAREPAVFDDAAFVCGLQAELQPDEGRHANNVGLFLREAGDRLLAGGAERGALAERWERVLEAYGRALELDPENANYLNDLAVVLHYYLQRDLDRAGELYRRAEQAAQRRLARPDASADERELLRIALRDARDNQGRLARYRELLEAGEQPDPLRVR